MSEAKSQQEYNIEEAFKEFLSIKKIGFTKNIFSQHIELSRKLYFIFSLILVTTTFLIFAQFALEISIHVVTGREYNLLVLHFLYGIVFFSVQHKALLAAN